MVWQRPDFLVPIHMTRTSLFERDELPTALAERNIPSIQMNSFSTEGPAITNYGQYDAIETTVGSDADNENYYALYGMFIGRILPYGKPMLIII